MRASVDTFATILKRYGVEPTPAADPAPMRATTLGEALEGCQTPIGIPGTKFSLDRDDAEPIPRYCCRIA